jgi:hypothetical protein
VFKLKENAPLEETVMTRWVRKTLLAVGLVGAGFAVGCGNNPEGKYRDPTGTVNAEFKGGNAYLAFGAMSEHGTYKIDGDKITVSGNLGPMIPSPAVFTVNSDGSIEGPKDSVFPRMEKVK